jgi:hypothetical protein
MALAMALAMAMALALALALAMAMTLAMTMALADTFSKHKRHPRIPEIPLLLQESIRRKYSEETIRNYQNTISRCLRGYIDIP